METNKNLKTVANYGKMNNVTASYIYRLAKVGKLSLVEIDGIKFVDTVKFPTIKG